MRGLLLLEQLKAGDRRSIGRSEAVVRTVLRSPGRLAELAAGLRHSDGLVRMRASDAVEKISRTRPEWLRPLKAELLALAAETGEKELRWHLAQLLPRLRLSRAQRQRLVSILRKYLRDRSAIVRVSALQALVELRQTDRTLDPLVRRQLQRALTSGTPSERARVRKLQAGAAAPDAAFKSLSLPYPSPRHRGPSWAPSVASVPKRPGKWAAH